MSKQGNAGKMLVGFVVRHKPVRPRPPFPAPSKILRGFPCFCQSVGYSIV
jgi:hypothetical protein